jgi:mannose-6-phosphate isomerase-like protein (cupin superfamily)
MQLDETHAVVLGPGEGESLPAPKRELHVKYEGEELEVLELVCEPGYGPVEPHVHDAHTDSFFILEGEVEFTIGDETVRAGPGTWVAAPSGVRHGFSIPGSDPARILNIQAPSGGFVGRIRNA